MVSKAPSSQLLFTKNGMLFSFSSLNQVQTFQFADLSSILEMNSYKNVQQKMLTDYFTPSIM